jgi:hypothetical protein
MLSVLKFATAPVPPAMAPPDQLAESPHVPPVVLDHVPLVWATASDAIMASASAATIALTFDERTNRSMLK